MRFQKTFVFISDAL